MLIILFFLLNLVDAVLTYFAISSGIGFESNPFVAIIIENGWVYFFIMKILLGLIVVYWSFKISLKYRTKALLFICLIYVLVVVNNLLVLVK